MISLTVYLVRGKLPPKYIIKVAKSTFDIINFMIKINCVSILLLEIWSIVPLEAFKVHVLADALERVAEEEVDYEDPDDSLLELVVGIRHKLECLSELVTTIENAASEHDEVQD